MNTTERSSKGVTLVAQACTKVQGFADLFKRLIIFPSVIAMINGIMKPTVTGTAKY